MRTHTHTHKHTYIHSGYFYSASSSPLLLKGAPDTAQIRYGKCRTGPRSLYMWRSAERDSNPRPFGRKASNIPMKHHAPQIHLYVMYITDQLNVYIYGVVLRIHDLHSWIHYEIVPWERRRCTRK